MSTKFSIVISAADGCGKPSFIRTMDNSNSSNMERKESFMFSNRLSSSLLMAALASAGLLLCAQPSFAALIASDNAGNTAYNSGWANGSNGGTGFGSWSLSTPSSSSYFFVQSSTVGNSSGGEIDTNNGAGQPVSWGMAGTSTNPSASRSFLAGSDGNSFLEQGQTFALSFENNYVATGAYVGYSLDSSAGQSLFSVFFPGGQGEYDVNSSPTLTGATALVSFGGSWTDKGVATTFTLSSPTSYTFTFQELNNSAPLLTMTGTVSAPITGFTAFNTGNATTSNNYYMFINSASVAGNPVPEPATLGLCAIGGLGLLLLKRRRTV
ncbi:MAG: PEP-CTERM sorting domain-containing protein [Phycisphaerae bacterium]